MAIQQDSRHGVTMPATDEFDDRVGRFSRRNLLRALIGLSTGAFVLAFGVPTFALKALQVAVQEVAAGDDLVYATAASGAAVGDPIRASDVQAGNAVQAYPKGKTDNQRNLITLIRVAPGQGKEGLVAYSSICTHLGCVVYAKLNEAGQIACPCHASRFDPAKGAAVLGGPAPRALPGLPLDVKPDGTVTAAGVFDGPVGAA